MLLKTNFFLILMKISNQYLIKFLFSEKKKQKLKMKIRSTYFQLNFLLIKEREEDLHQIKKKEKNIINTLRIMLLQKFKLII
jgi:hypothetical protein